PPPLPTSERARNAALSGTAPAPMPAINMPPPPPPPPSDVLKQAYIPASAARPKTQDIMVDPSSLENVVIHLSGYAPNILVTPFHHPLLIYTEANAVKWSPYGDRMILSINPEHPVGVVVTGHQSGDPTVSMTLVPIKTIGRNYRLIIDHWHPNPEKASSRLPESRRNAHFLAIMKAAAMGVIPSGYVRSSHLPAEQKGGDLKITPYARYDGGNYALTEYRVRNLSAESTRLVESNFYHPGVVAVTFWPSGEISGNGSAKIFILTKQDQAKHSGLLGFVGKE
ncbi:type-F conjugative transfer system secretin TraK, partial [Acidithiobacillus sp. MC6.1]|nr:type-F conjugative transfer system secretin TraK [Acidithiobacillus sp. MC6.1]